MSTTLKLCKREIIAYLSSPAFYIFLVVFVGVSGAMFFYVGRVFTERFAQLNNFFTLLPFLLLCFVPAVAMRLWAEENKSGTTELLMTLPVRDWEAVLGKYLAALMVIVLGLALTFPIPMIVAHLARKDTPLDLGPVFGGYAGMAAMGAVFLALANMVSALTKNQVVAFILGISTCFGIFILGRPPVLEHVPQDVVPFLSFIGVGGHLDGFAVGVFDTRSVLYFVSLVVVLLFATVRILESRRWR